MSIKNSDIDFTAVTFTIYNTVIKGFFTAITSFLITISTLVSLQANEARIVGAKIALLADNKFQIDVTIAHADEGWDHYANGWDVLDDRGNLLGTRVLHHPHVNEQPFTRGLLLTIPVGIIHVTIVAHDSVHEDNPETYQLAVPRRQQAVLE